MRRDAADHAPLAPREEQLHFRVLVERVLAGREQLDDFAPKRRYPVGISGVDPVGKVDEGIEVCLAGNRGNHYFCCRHAIAFVQGGLALRMVSAACQAHPSGASSRRRAALLETVA